MASIAFIGMGIMGTPMAGHLLAAGHALAVHSRTKSKAAGLIERGATWAESPAAAARGAEVIFICVTDTPDVQAVVQGSGGILETASPGTVVVDHSTISPSVTRRLARTLAENEIDFIDAPVSGGDVGARNATLSIMCGGEPGPFERVKPLLDVMGKTVILCGPAGHGQLTKLVNQILVSVTNLAVCEALTFAQKSGLDPEKALSVLVGGAGNSWQLANLGPRMIKHDFAPGFMIDLMQKDLRLVMAAAQESGVCLPAASLVHHLFTSAQAAGDGRQGTQALFAVIEKLAGAQ